LWDAESVKTPYGVPSDMPVLEALGTAIPGPGVAQREVKAKAQEILGVLAPELVEKLDVFVHTGIDTRYFVRPLEWYLEPHGWAERNKLFAEEGTALMEAATLQALERADIGPHDVDGVILVSTTGIATPSLDARLANRVGLAAGTQRIPVFGLGCAGGVAGWNLAGDLARAHPDKRFLLLAMETCSLAFNMQDMSVRAFVATTLFADGCAAAIVRGDDLDGPSLGHVRAGASHQWRATEDVMGWDVLDEGLRVVFSRRIPEIVAHQFAPVVESYLKREAMAPDRYVFHPGGTKVLEAYAAALDVPPAAFAVSRDILREFGNMSSPTALFALERSLDRTPLEPGETALLAALGPGFTAELGALEG
jgi:alkylresorcinol/alkylpyrone synthase